MKESDMNNLSEELEKKIVYSFPYEYRGGGYFRMKGVPEGEKADIIHGAEILNEFYHHMKKELGYNNQCPQCKGTGALQSRTLDFGAGCPKCEGTGIVSPTLTMSSEPQIRNS